MVPDLNTTLHLDMLRRYQRNRAGLFKRLYRAFQRELKQDTYGLGWGDPETVEPLKYVRDHYVLPYVKPEHVALEIGPGGGRWTRYLLDFRQLYVVDYYKEVLEELRRNIDRQHMVFVRNNGSDFPGIDDCSIDFLFTFGAFVHMDVPIVDSYLSNIRRLLRSGANAVIHYSDNTKVMARMNKSFSDNNPEVMRSLLAKHGYKILEEDLTSMWHSSLVRFTI